MTLSIKKAHSIRHIEGYHISLRTLLFDIDYKCTYWVKPVDSETIHIESKDT